MKDRMQLGPVFGSRDSWSGLAILADTYSNHNGPHNHQHPYLSALVIIIQKYLASKIIVKPKVQIKFFLDFGCPNLKSQVQTFWTLADTKIKRSTHPTTQKLYYRPLILAKYMVFQNVTRCLI